jgi:hypothetical protein
MGEIKFWFYGFALLLSKSSIGQVDLDTSLEKSVYNPSISWFSSYSDFVKNKKTYGNGVDFLDFKFSSDSLPSEFCTRFSNGDTALHYSIIRIEKVPYPKGENFYLKIQDKQITYYKSKKIRSCLVDTDSLKTYLLYDEKGIIRYKENIIYTDTLNGLFATSYISNGVMFKMYKKGKLKYYVKTDILNNITEIKSSNGKICNDIKLERYLQNVLFFKYNGDKWLGRYFPIENE